MLYLVLCLGHFFAKYLLSAGLFCMSVLTSATCVINLIIKVQRALVLQYEKMAHYKGASSEANRAAALLKQREKDREELERLKKKITEVCFVSKNPFLLRRAHCRTTKSAQEWRKGFLLILIL